MIRILSLFTLCENVHLTKDVGMIPYILYKDYGYDSTIACYKNGEYPNLNTEVKGLKQVFIKRKFNNHTLDSLLHILFNFRKYDVLQCYHLTTGSLMVLTLFKLLKSFSKRAVTYLKLDADDEIKHVQFKGLSGFLSGKAITKIDMVSIENLALHQYLNEHNILGRKVIYVPNGFYTIDPGFKNFDDKENTILTVGRIGTVQKANEILLEAFKQFSVYNKDWKLQLVGPVEESFAVIIDDFFEVNPELKERVVFTGPVNDRQVISNIYDKAKIFVLSSRWEGFPLVFLEAIKAGCTILSSDIVSAYDVTDNQKYGRIFPVDDSAGLNRLLQEVANDQEYLRENSLAIQKFGYDKFYWPNICNVVNESIISLLK